MKFKAKVIPSGNALGPEARPFIVVAIQGHPWCCRVAKLVSGLAAKS